MQNRLIEDRARDRMSYVYARATPDTIYEHSPANPPENISSGLVFPSLGFPRILEVDNFRSRFSVNPVVKTNQSVLALSPSPIRRHYPRPRLTSNNASLSSTLDGRARGKDRLGFQSSDGDDLNRPDGRSGRGGTGRSNEGSGEHDLRIFDVFCWCGQVVWKEFRTVDSGPSFIYTGTILEEPRCTDRLIPAERSRSD
jgi:hypothetical protein